jgi:signal peptidase I
MPVDFALILVVATGVTGIVWAFDALWLQRRRLAAAAATGPGTTVAEPVLVEYSRSFFPVLLLVLLVRSFLFEPFRIPSGSMMPTLLVGDFIFVNKYAYGLRLPVLNKKILENGKPQRGDIIVFRLPSDPSINYIKRLVGLPGDTIRYADKKLYVNGQPIEAAVTGFYDGEDQIGSVLGTEKLGNIEHRVLLIPGMRSVEGTFVVPAGHYFMMGDNRDNSKDSRYIGAIPEENLVGKAAVIWLNFDFSLSHAPRWERIGHSVY